MFILITGIPGTGKTTIANELKKHNKRFEVVSDKEFCLTLNIGQDENKEQVVDIKELSKAFLEYLRENKKKHVIFEGHLWSELPKSLLKKMNFVFVLVASKTLVKKRLSEREYSQLKIIENIFCQETNYLEDLLNSKNIFFYKINVNDNVKANLSKINKHINF